MRFPRLADLWRCFPESKPARRRRASTRLIVEGLEPRWVPASFAAATVAELIADINAANLTPEPDTVTLAAGETFTLVAEDNFANGLPQIAAGEDLTIVGNGATIERSTAADVPEFRLFDVTSGASLTLQDLTLQGGRVVWRGGAVLNQGALTLENVTVQNNVASGLSPFGAWGHGINAMGGGIYSSGTLTIDDSQILKNEALGGPGGNGSWWPGDGGPYPIPAGDGGDGMGGGIYVAAGTVTIHNTTISGNTAKGGPGGKGHVDNYPDLKSPNGDRGQGIGGGIYIDAAAWLGLDSFSLDNCKTNKASTDADNIAGDYDVIP